MLEGPTEYVCECKMDVKSTWILTWHLMDHVSWLLGIFSKSSFGGGPNTKPGDHDTPNAHNRWFILFYYVWGSTWIEKSLKQHMVEGLVTYGFTLYLRVRDHTTWFRRCLGTAFGRFLLGSHNFLVTAFGSCVKWPWEPVTGTLQALSLVEMVERVQVRFTLRLRDQRSTWMLDGCKVYVDTYMASNGSCFIVTWGIFKNHLLEVGLTQNRETVALWT